MVILADCRRCALSPGRIAACQLPSSTFSFLSGYERGVEFRGRDLRFCFGRPSAPRFRETRRHASLNIRVFALFAPSL